jgi:hypothetical protein
VSGSLLLLFSLLSVQTHSASRANANYVATSVLLISLPGSKRLIWQKGEVDPGSLMTQQPEKFLKYMVHTREYTCILVSLQIA